MFRAFVGRKNQSLHNSFLHVSFQFLSSFFYLTMQWCVYLCVSISVVHPEQNVLLYKSKIVITCVTLDEKENKEQRHFLFCFLPPCASANAQMYYICVKVSQAQSIWHIRVKGCRCFHFFTIPPNKDTKRWQMLSTRRLKHECEVIWIDVIPGEINAFF